MDRKNMKSARPVKESVIEYARGVVGGLMFSIPVIYTMEVWWVGMELSSTRLLAMIALTALLLLGYNTYAGVRHDETWAGIVIDSVEEFGLALVVSTAALTLTNRISLSEPPREVVGKVVIEALLVAIGISIGTAQIHDDGKDDENEDERRGARPSDIWGVLTVSTCGAVVFATNVAVTDEVVLLALESGPYHLIGMILASLLLAAVVSVYSNLLENDDSEQRFAFMTYAFGTTLSYSVAVVVSALILYLFGRFDGVALTACLSMIVILSVPATLGAAAGKLLIK